MLHPTRGTCSDCSNRAAIISTYCACSFGNDPPPKVKGSPPTPRLQWQVIGLGLQVAQSWSGEAFVGVYPSRAPLLQQGIFLLSEDSKAGDLDWNQGLV